MAENLSCIDFEIGENLCTKCGAKLKQLSPTITLCSRCYRYFDGSRVIDIRTELWKLKQKYEPKNKCSCGNEIYTYEVPGLKICIGCGKIIEM